MKYIVVSGLKSVIAETHIVKNAWLGPGFATTIRVIQKKASGMDDVTIGQIA